jgi:osmotically-inducible protein OsmY
MKTDSEIREDVESELRWDPGVETKDIVFSVKDGVVALNGYVPSYGQKFETERDVKRVAGVRGIANDIEVRLPTLDQRPDPDVADDAVHALRIYLPFLHDHIKVVVKDGWLTLSGNAEWHFQSERAETSVRHLRGVKGVINTIAVKPHVSPADVKARIQEALKRNAAIDANNITVEADGGKVVLRGKVRSWAERREAETAAWRAPGVTLVEDHVSIAA